MKSKERHDCPACGTALVSEPLRCKTCGWHLISLKEWQALKPFGQGYAHYMQAAWPTSELAEQKNPYAKGTAEYEAFQRGAERAALDAQDSEA